MWGEGVNVEREARGGEEVEVRRVGGGGRGESGQ